MLRPVTNAVCAVLVGAIYVVKVASPPAFLVSRWRMMGAGGVAQVWDGIPEAGAVPFWWWLKGIGGWIVPYALAGYLVAGLVPAKQRWVGLLPVVAAAGWALAHLLWHGGPAAGPGWSTLFLWALALWSLWGGAALRNWRRDESRVEAWHAVAQTAVLVCLFALPVAEPDSNWGVTHFWTERLRAANGQFMDYTAYVAAGNFLGLGCHGRVIAFFVLSFAVVGAGAGLLARSRAVIAAVPGALLARYCVCQWAIPRPGYAARPWWALAGLAAAGALAGAALAGALSPWLYVHRSELAARLRDGWVRFRRLDTDL
jgi:hypothetical protein